MNELARAIVLLCQILEAQLELGESEQLEELQAIYVTLLRRGESAAGYHTRSRGLDNLSAAEQDANVKDAFPTTEPRSLPQKELR